MIFGEGEVDCQCVYTVHCRERSPIILCLFIVTVGYKGDARYEDEGLPDLSCLVWLSFSPRGVSRAQSLSGHLLPLLKDIVRRYQRLAVFPSCFPQVMGPGTRKLVFCRCYSVISLYRYTVICCNNLFSYTLVLVRLPWEGGGGAETFRTFYDRDALCFDRLQYIHHPLGVSVSFKSDS
jgi:hypothetical protein